MSEYDSMQSAYGYGPDVSRSRGKGRGKTRGKGRGRTQRQQGGLLAAEKRQIRQYATRNGISEVEAQRRLYSPGQPVEQKPSMFSSIFRAPPPPNPDRYTGRSRGRTQRRGKTRGKTQRRGRTQRRA